MSGFQDFERTAVNFGWNQMVNYKGYGTTDLKILKSEMFVTERINHIIYECLQQKDYNVHNFMQRF